MHKVYEARDRIQAQMFLDYLRERGIQSVILRDFLSGGAGELPADIGPALWVLDEDDLEPARELLRRLERTPAPSERGADWVCVGCGERLEGQFLSCWRCGRPRTD